MKAADNMNNRRMNFFLWYLVIAAPFHLLGLQFYFSSKGTLLSSAIAAAFGALLIPAGYKHTGLQPTLTLISPFLLIACFYLSFPTHQTMLFGLAVISLSAGLQIVTQTKHTVMGGGRGELSLILKSAADPLLLKNYQLACKAWAAAGIVTVLVSSAIASQWTAFLLPAAIAVILSSVINSPHAKENR
jgi:hypothetical protein